MAFWQRISNDKDSDDDIDNYITLCPQGTGVCVAFWQRAPGTPRVATVLVDGLGLLCSLRLRQEVRADPAKNIQKISF